jgi:ribulose-phosphate 3-epimerase
VVIYPGTPVHALNEILPLVHRVLVMSVNPGFGGQTFIRSSLRKIELLSRIRKSRGLEFRIEVDGGVHHDTVADVVRAGGQILVAGSAIFEQGDPQENARQLLESALEAANPAGQDLSSVVAGGGTDDGCISLDPP